MQFFFIIKKYDTMNGAEREQAMLKCAVLEDEVKGLKNQNSMSVQTEEKILSGKHSTSVNKAGKSKKFLHKNLKILESVYVFKMN